MKAQNANRIYRSTQHPFAEKTSRLRHASALAGIALALLWHSPVQATLADYQTAVTNTASLISYYTFDQSNAADARGMNNGTLMGTTAFATGVGGAGKALVLDGTGRMNLGVVEAFAFTNGPVRSRLGCRPETWASTAASPRIVMSIPDGRPHERGQGGIGMWNGWSYYPTIPIPNAGPPIGITLWPCSTAAISPCTGMACWRARPIGRWVTPMSR